MLTLGYLGCSPPDPSPFLNVCEFCGCSRQRRHFPDTPSQIQNDDVRSTVLKWCFIQIAVCQEKMAHCFSFLPTFFLFQVFNWLNSHTLANNALFRWVFFPPWIHVNPLDCPLLRVHHISPRLSWSTLQPPHLRNYRKPSVGHFHEPWNCANWKIKTCLMQSRQFWKDFHISQKAPTLRVNSEF